jgi:mycofactocin system creatininase family protein
MRTRSPGSQRRAVNAVREHHDPGAAARPAGLAWPGVAERAEAGALLAVPLGSTEQQGPHLPLSTDADFAVALCERLAAARGDVLTYGSSGEHADFPGTPSIGQAALESLIVELGRSAARTLTRLLLFSAHGNAGPVTRAAGRPRAESRDVHVYMPRWEDDPQAGRPEASMMLALAPARVRMHLAAPGGIRPLAQIWPLLRAEGLHAVNAAGILGDPTGASHNEGAALLDTLAAQRFREVDAWHPVSPEARA